MARGQIKRIVRTIGEQRTLAILQQALEREQQALEREQQALEREQQGGLLLPDGKRRTLGGVFFGLVKEQTTVEERRQVWFYQGRVKAAQLTEPSATG